MRVIVHVYPADEILYPTYVKREPEVVQLLLGVGPQHPHSDKLNRR